MNSLNNLLTPRIFRPQQSNDHFAQLLVHATTMLDVDRSAARICIQRAATLLGIDLSNMRAAPPGNSCRKGGLAPWQAKRVSSYIDENLASRLRVGDLADIVHLSGGHFFRAFRRSFDESPRAYILRLRMQRCQELLLSSHHSLAQIAHEIGMCDQAHFSRTFRRVVGCNPKAWRRQFTSDPRLRIAPLDKPQIASERALEDASTCAAPSYSKVPRAKGRDTLLSQVAAG